MSRVRSLRRERRTGLEFVENWVAEHASKAEAAREMGLDPAHLRIWLLQADRRFDPDTARRVALAVGLPIEALLFKNERICDLLRNTKQQLSELATESAA